jgi:tetratricopeptide (TPR) repeat protein
VHDSIGSGRRALALAQEIKNVWVQVISTNNLTHGLLDAGAYEEALGLTQQTVALARTLPPAMSFQVFLTVLGSTYQAVQQWEEAHRTLAEAEAVAETLDLGPLRVPTLSRLCMHYALVGEWEAAYRYALKAITVRKRYAVELFLLDFYRHYETEALLRGGMRARREQKCNDSGNVWGTIGASAFPTCGLRLCWPPGKGTASRPSATYTKPPS